jgi:hypothetical protein
MKEDTKEPVKEIVENIFKIVKIYTDEIIEKKYRKKEKKKDVV